MYVTGIKENGIKHSYIADKGNTLLEVRESIHVVLKLIQIIEIKDGLYVCPKKEHFWKCIKFETDKLTFLDLEYPNFDPKHGFLSSVEAEIISFFQRRQPFAFLALLFMSIL